MGIIHMNFHPKGNWKVDRCELYGKGDGECISIGMCDDGNERVDFAIHYYGNPMKLIGQLKDKINGLPDLSLEMEEKGGEE